jgi:hypothetical protein
MYVSSDVPASQVGSRLSLVARQPGAPETVLPLECPADRELPLIEAVELHDLAWVGRLVCFASSAFTIGLLVLVIG